jgi:elongation factor Ts
LKESRPKDDHPLDEENKMVDILKQIKDLRKKTGAGVMDCRRALEESKGDFKKAQAWLKKKGLKTAAKKKDRETEAGLVEAYIHSGGRVGAIVSLGCETDFVAQTKEFKKLALELGMQVAAMNPKSVKKLLEQEYIRDPKKKIRDLVDETIAKLGENIKINQMDRLEI